MRKPIVLLCVLGMMVLGSTSLWAGGADNKTNWSVEYIRTLNRNAATDSADIVMYNPAGVMKMEDGFYGNLSVHYIAKEYNNQINGTDFDTDEPSAVPGLFTVYKQERWAAYFGVSNVVGGGKVKFEQGNATTALVGFSMISMGNAGLGAAGVPSSFFYSGISGQTLKAEQIGLGVTVGGAYKLNDKVSLSLGLRYVKTDIEMDGVITVSATNPMPGANDDLTANASFEEEAKGIGGVIGINYSPNDQWNIGLHYDTKVDLDFDQTVKMDNLGILPSLGITNGGERTRNLPAVIALGVSYKVDEKIRVESDLTYYVNSNADFPDILGTPRDESAVDDGYDLGICVEYTFSETLRASLGYLYTNTGVDAKDMRPELPELDAHTIGTGIAWKVMPNMELNFALGHVFYDDASFISSTTGATITYEKDITFIGFGIQYKFF